MFFIMAGPNIMSYDLFKYKSIRPFELKITFGMLLFLQTIEFLHQ